jgi:hypothetical protein
MLLKEREEKDYSGETDIYTGETDCCAINFLTTITRTLILFLCLR